MMPSVTVAQSKVLHIEKDATVPGGTADVVGDDQLHAGGDQQGNAAIAGVVVSDPFTTNEAPVLNGAFNIGDTDQDNLLDVGDLSSTQPSGDAVSSWMPARRSSTRRR